MARASSALLKRRLDIAEIVRKQGEVKVDELSELLNVSGVTIRQDLTYLEQQGYLKRSFGGAIYIGPESAGVNNKTTVQPVVATQDNYDIELVLNCLDYIHDGETIFLGHGALIQKLIPFLHNKKSLTLMVNDLEHAQLAREFTQAEVIVVGGFLLDNHVVMDNKLLNVMINQYPINHFIIEVAAINADNELNIEHTELIKSYQQVIKSAASTIAIFPQRAMYSDVNCLDQLNHIDIAILSRAAVTEYHQQLLDCHFIQVSANKRSLIYQNQLSQ